MLRDVCKHSTTVRGRSAHVSFVSTSDRAKSLNQNVRLSWNDVTCSSIRKGKRRAMLTCHDIVPKFTKFEGLVD